MQVREKSEAGHINHVAIHNNYIYNDCNIVAGIALMLKMILSSQKL